MTGPRNARTTSRGRVYQWPATGESFWSVTTILSALPKPALLPWGMRSVAEAAVAQHDRVSAMVTAAGDDPEARKAVVDWLKGEPYRQRDKAADLGSLVHARIESLILGKPEPPAPPVAVGFIEAFDAFVRDWRPEFLAAEMSVYNRTASYAGTLDWIARIGDVTVLGDTKTGKDVYPEAALQLCAYARAEFAGMPDGTEGAMPVTDEARVLHLRSDGTYSLVPVRTDDDVWQTFLYVAQVFRWQEEISKTVVGEPMTSEPVGLLEAV
jgi:hypothetical protein